MFFPKCNKSFERNFSRVLLLLNGFSFLFKTTINALNGYTNEIIIIKMTNEVTHLKSSGTGWELQEQIQTTSCLWKKRRKLSKHEMKNEA